MAFLWYQVTREERRRDVSLWNPPLWAASPLSYSSSKGSSTQRRGVNLQHSMAFNGIQWHSKETQKTSSKTQSVIQKVFYTFAGLGGPLWAASPFSYSSSKGSSTQRWPLQWHSNGSQEHSRVFNSIQEHSNGFQWFSMAFNNIQVYFDWCSYKVT